MYEESHGEPHLTVDQVAVAEMNSLLSAEEFMWERLREARDAYARAEAADKDATGLFKRGMMGRDQQQEYHHAAVAALERQQDAARHFAEARDRLASRTGASTERGTREQSSPLPRPEGQFTPRLQSQPASQAHGSAARETQPPAPTVTVVAPAPAPAPAPVSSGSPYGKSSGRGRKRRRK
ncbi:hypothetical protein [Streptomyces daliensis]|uniref:Uncharacterized protein n=1 Tax=Streptomyces daliensis TaxID=299421 RepID=A0A8T4IUE1_9ACTN|nr:hypothetical protein [Streptomyces daliensis]